MYQDGAAAMSYEEVLAKCRFFDTPPSPENPKPPYAAVCDVVRWTAGICELRGFKGAVGRRHIRLLVKALSERGFRVAYLDRPDGQGLDHVATRVDGGDFDGWYRLDLAYLAEKLRMNNGTAAS